MWAVVGLGNPGREYEKTRHNAGRLFILDLARRNKVKLKKRKYRSETIVMDMESERIMLAAPKTYMNTSGEAVRQLIQSTGVRIERLVVVYDDLDIPLGEIRIRKKGGPGTHRGMESVVREIRTGDFPRIRIGIGPMPSGIEATQYVLAPFSRKEKLF